MNTHKDLDVWNISIELVIELYKSTSDFPKSELFSLTQQIRRAVISIPSNISEGYGRGSVKERVRYLHIALGSQAEVETQLIICEKLGYLSSTQFEHLDSMNKRVGQMLVKLIQAFKKY
mgnify:CR=1 FL=1